MWVIHSDGFNRCDIHTQNYFWTEVVDSLSFDETLVLEDDDYSDGFVLGKLSVKQAILREWSLEKCDTNDRMRAEERERGRAREEKCCRCTWRMQSVVKSQLLRVNEARKDGNFVGWGAVALHRRETSKKTFLFESDNQGQMFHWERCICDKFDSQLQEKSQ